VVFTFHGLSFLDRNYELGKTFRLAARFYFAFLLRHIEDYVFVSRCNKNEAVRTRLADNGHVIYNGLNEKELHFSSREEAREILKNEYGVDLSNSFVVGSVGRLAYPKNYDFLIRNFNLFKKEIPDLKFVIVGSGPKLDKYKKLIEENNCSESFFLAGAIKDSYRIVKAFDVFTLPSRFEGLSISMIEALYAEVPILASEIDGNKEVLDNDERQFYKLDDPNEYIQKLLAIKKNADTLSAHNSKLKLRFTLEKMSSEYINVYKALTENK
jgi:glycosyltransferase involved in cell wall biosynthesis